MKNCLLAFSFVALSVLSAVNSEDCDKCLKKDLCLAFGKLNKQEQDAWQIKHPCSTAEDDEARKVFGFDPIAKGDFVCCSNVSQASISVSSRHPDYNNFGNNNYDDGNTGYPNTQTQNGYDFGNNSPENNDWGSDETDNTPNPNQGSYGYQPTVYPPSPPKNYFNVNNSPYVTSSPFFPVHGHGNSGGGNQGQCPITSFPPKPETGCCGREASDTDRIIDKPKPPSYYDTAPGNQHQPNSYEDSDEPSWPSQRVARSAPVEVGTRIAGGRETELEQFPWTVLLEITFDYGDKKQAFNCGGSLLSSRYVLTAGHCVYDKGGQVTNIDIYLAEYDKSTFPKDCKNVLGVGQKCIENIVMKAKEFTLHPKYDDDRLNNDIALIRIADDAPYTDYIRPICLPSIDIDNPDFSNLRLAVAGWGRNGRYRSDVKQSTIVNLVPQADCKKFYPNLSRRQMCAAGYTGEDTCKGDSGGPLMTVYGGKYEVVGVVSGKRADSPCGTSVPSLYTSVYHYSDWIRTNMT